MTIQQLLSQPFTQDRSENTVLLNPSSVTRPKWVMVNFTPSEGVPTTWNTFGFGGLYQSIPWTPFGTIVLNHPTFKLLFDKSSSFDSGTTLSGALLFENPDNPPNVHFWGVAVVVHKWVPDGTLKLYADL